MRKLYLVFTLALLVALVATVSSDPMPIEERLVRVQAEDLLEGFPDINEQPPELQAALLDMADDELLLLKARAAYIRYPDLTREIFPLYGPEPEFREALVLYGENILPPIHYFLNRRIGSIELMDSIARKYRQARDYFGDGDSGTPEPAREAPGQSGKDGLEPVERGWYAINFILAEGHDFLGQFVVDDQGQVTWVRTERVLEGLSQFFASGIRELEIKHRTGEDITAGDIGWASVDVLVFASALKVLRVGRAAAATTKGSARSTRTAAFAARLSNSGRMLLNSARYAKWPAVVAVGYLVVSHPSVISDVLAGAAQALGYPVWLVQFLGWLLLLLPALYIGSWILRFILRPVFALLGGLFSGLARVSRRNSLDRIG